MGIQSFNKIFTEEQLLSPKDLNKSTIFIDLNIILYKFITAKFQLSTEDDKITNHIQGLFNNIIDYKKRKINAVFILDSPSPPEIKKDCLIKRSETKKHSINREIREQALELLRYSGFSVIITPNGIEAEQLAASLTKTTSNSYVLTTDPDTLVFGATRMLVKKGQKYKLKTLENILKIVGSQENLAIISVALGCDFAEKLKGIGPKSIQKLITEKKISSLKDKFTDCQKAAVDFFLNTQIPPESKQISSTEDRESIFNLLTKKYNFNPDNTKKKLDQVFK